jgi:predicted RNase H-like HicB family nuclease
MTSRPAGFIRLAVVARFDEEVGRFVVGSPDLDVWSSGEEEKQALDRAGEAIELFLNEAAQMGTVWKILEDAGIRLETSRPAGMGPLMKRLKYAVRGDFFPLTFPIPAQPQAC